MGQRLCAACGELMTVETIGGRPGRPVTWCPTCNVVHDVAERDTYEFPRSSDDRHEAEAWR